MWQRIMTMWQGKGLTMKQFSWIENGVLAASDLPRNADDVAFLAEQGVRVVVTLTENPITYQRIITEAMLAEHNIETYHAPIRDMYAPNDPTYTYPIMQFISEMHAEKKPVLLHCLAGMGRTGTLLHAYYLHQGHSLDEARAKILAVRPYSAWTELSDVQRDFLTTLAEGLRNGWRV
jgi:atypical dual specificity phosphatase